MSSIQVTTTEIQDCGANQKRSRSVSFSRSGLLAYGLADRTARIMDINNHKQDIHTLTGHTGAVTKVKFHPAEHSTLLTASIDNTIKLWDCRQGSKITNTFEGKQTVYVEWGRDSPCHTFVATERSGKVCVYDRRKTSSANREGAAVHVFDQIPCLVDAAIMFNGDYLIGGLTQHGEGMADIGVWRWNKKENDMDTGDSPSIYRYPAHAGPIFCMDLSPDGKRLATGGSDALVSLWDTDSMICTSSLPSPTKFVRHVAFSGDGRILAASSDENDIFLVEASTGLALTPITLGGNRRCGAEEVCWHPTSTILACARSDMDRPNPIAIAKLSVSKSSQ